jgi:hypothetical protein
MLSHDRLEDLGRLHVLCLRVDARDALRDAFRACILVCCNNQPPCHHSTTYFEQSLLPLSLYFDWSLEFRWLTHTIT